MTADEQKKKMEDAERGMIIESQILLRTEQLGGLVSDERKTGLKRMTKPELQQLVQELNSATASQDAISMIVKAIRNSDSARLAEEDKKWNALGGSARVDMDL